MSATRFADCYRCGYMFEDVESIIFAGGGWCPVCDQPAQRTPTGGGASTSPSHRER